MNGSRAIACWLPVGQSTGVPCRYGVLLVSQFTLFAVTAKGAPSALYSSKVAVCRSAARAETDSCTGHRIAGAGTRPDFHLAAGAEMSGPFFAAFQERVAVVQQALSIRTHHTLSICTHHWMLP